MKTIISLSVANDTVQHMMRQQSQEVDILDRFIKNITRVRDEVARIDYDTEDGVAFEKRVSDLKKEFRKLLNGQLGR